MSMVFMTSCVARDLQPGKGMRSAQVKTFERVSPIAHPGPTLPLATGSTLDRLNSGRQNSVDTNLERIQLRDNGFDVGGGYCVGRRSFDDND